MTARGWATCSMPSRRNCNDRPCNRGPCNRGPGNRGRRNTLVLPHRAGGPRQVRDDRDRRGPRRRDRRAPAPRARRRDAPLGGDHVRARRRAQRRAVSVGDPRHRGLLRLGDPERRDRQRIRSPPIARRHQDRVHPPRQSVGDGVEQPGERGQRRAVAWQLLLPSRQAGEPRVRRLRRHDGLPLDRVGRGVPRDSRSCR